ncbi:hypothetical protein KSP39_PZI023493 [Platanthera zijinensis]|uniref:PSII 6.1 kDa protein n=1 Tax=Platanthera zijinensis TaxID=2320716 RepID=A0AAP0AS90_9ASPA
MATITAAAPIVASAALHRKQPPGVSTTFVVGLPQIRIQGGRLPCWSTKNNRASAQLFAAVASMFGATGPALALVDERLSTEGTGLSLGLSNNLLGWILLGVFGLIWALYFVYTSTLEEDEESGLSL